MGTKVRHLIFAGLLITGTVAARLTDHLPNVAPVAAVSLLSGSLFPLPVATLIPLLAMAISDAVLGPATWPITASVYGAFALTAVIGRLILRQRTAGRTVTASLLASALFYLITNAAVWRFGSLYPSSLDGLILSYYIALPFFRLTLLGDLAYTTSLCLAAEYGPALIRSLVRLSTRLCREPAWYKERGF